MKATFESVSRTDNGSFIVRKFREKKFSAPFHFHPELELTYIEKGNGKRYTGSNMHGYSAGDLVLLGPNLPHCWKTDDDAPGYSLSYVVHFNSDFLGDEFFTKAELARVAGLLKKSCYGIQFTKINTAVVEKITTLPNEKDGFEKLISFLEVLNMLARSSFILLDKQSPDPALSAAERERIHAVMGYIVENFQKSASLKEAAAIANMTTHAFCKYFRRITRKTFVEALNDYRLGFATKQLVNTDKTISQIAFESGFNEVSNFHKTFKRKINTSPLAYRNNFLKKAGG